MGGHRVRIRTGGTVGPARAARPWRRATAKRRLYSDPRGRWNRARSRHGPGAILSGGPSGRSGAKCKPLSGGARTTVPQATTMQQRTTLWASSSLGSLSSFAPPCHARKAQRWAARGFTTTRPFVYASGLGRLGSGSRPGSGAPHHHPRRPRPAGASLFACKTRLWSGGVEAGASLPPFPLPLA